VIGFRAEYRISRRSSDDLDAQAHALDDRLDRMSTKAGSQVTWWLTYDRA
jgi:hypothetical protein